MTMGRLCQQHGWTARTMLLQNDGISRRWLSDWLHLQQSLWVNPMLSNNLVTQCEVSQVYFLLLPSKEWRSPKQLKELNISLEIGFNFYHWALIEGLEHKKEAPGVYHEMIEWYDSMLFGDINPRDETPDDGGEEEMAMDPNEVFFQLWEKEWEERHALEVRLRVCGLDPWSYPFIRLLTRLKTWVPPCSQQPAVRMKGHLHSLRSSLPWAMRLTLSPTSALLRAWIRSRNKADLVEEDRTNAVIGSQLEFCKIFSRVWIHLQKTV